MHIAFSKDMNLMNAFVAFISIAVMYQAVIGGVVVSAGETYYLKLRTGQHYKFFRIALEGAESIMSKGVVSQKGEDILVSFPDSK
jgi:hypothetical protein